MTTIPTAVAAKPVLHCFRECRSPQSYTRVKGISRPVYTCDGCGATREIDELGVTNVTRTLPELAPKLPPFVAPRTRIYTNRRKETTVNKNPIQAAIDAAVKSHAGTFVTKEEFDELADKLGAAATPKELDQHVERILEKILPERINAALLQLLAVPAKQNRGGRLSGPCPRQPHKGKCPSTWCINAEKKATAEAEG